MTKHTTFHKITAAIAALVLLLMGLAALPTSIPEVKVTDLKEGTHYQRVAKDSLTNADIAIFFWYGCPHCSRVYHAMERDGFFTQAKSDNLTVRKVPVALNKDWVEHAKLFYAFDAKGLSLSGHIEVMNEIQSTRAISGRKLDTIIERVIKQEKLRTIGFNTDLNEIKSLMSSDKVQALMKRDAQLAAQVKLKGVPTFLINGIYSATLGSDVGYSDLPAIGLRLAKGDE